MPHPTVKDGAGAVKSIKGTGVGSDADPWILSRAIDSIAAGANRIGKVTVRNAVDSADIDPLSEATFAASMGEVQASPTAFTQLARLKDLLTGIILAAGSNIIGSARHAGPHWTPSDFIVDSADATALADFSFAPTSGEKIVIDDLVISVGTAMTVTVTEETTGDVLYKLYMTANSTEVISPRNGRKLASVNKKVQIQASAIGNIFAHLSYHSAA